MGRPRIHPTDDASRRVAAQRARLAAEGGAILSLALSAEDRAAVEALRQREGLRSAAEAIRHAIRKPSAPSTPPGHVGRKLR